MASITLCDLFSKPRIAAYYNAFKIKDDRECLALYFQTLEASSKMLHIINLIEVILRNRLHAQIKQLADNGLLPMRKDTSSGMTISPDFWFKSVTDGFSRSHLKVVRLSNRFNNFGIIPTADDYIAQLDFGYYVYLLHQRHEKPQNKFNYIWQPGVMHNVFPGAIKHKRTLSGLFGLLLQCDDIRNRLCHHEPMWKGKLPDCYENIRQKFRLLLDILEFLSPDMKQIVLDTEIAGFYDVKQLFVTRCRNKYKNRMASVVFLP